MIATPLLLVAGLAAPVSPSGNVYERALEKALDRAQTGLVDRTDLWKDHSRWEDPWEVYSNHYVVRTTDSYYQAKNVAEGLESMLGHFQTILDTDYVPAQPFPVWIFPSLAEYNDYGNANGAEHSSILGSFYSSQTPELSVVTYQIANPILLRMWITHSAVHQYLDRAFSVTPPTSVVEGLASYFSLYWDWNYGADEHRRLVGSSAFIPLQNLLTDPIQSYPNNPHDRFMELGMLFNFLLHHDEETRLAPDGAEPDASFAEYLRGVLRGQDVSQMGFAQLIARRQTELERSFRDFDFSD